MAIKERFHVTGMTCSACSAHVENAVGKLDGVTGVSVNLLTGSMDVSYTEGELSGERIVRAVTDAGYSAARAENSASKETQEGSEGKAELDWMRRRVIISFIFLIPLFYLSMGHMLKLPLPSFFHGNENALNLALTQLLFCLPIVYMNDKYYKTGFKTLFRGAPTMDSLIAIGSSAAVIYGVAALYFLGYGLGHNDMALVHRYSMELYFESAGMILTLITLGKYLETRSKNKTSDAITKLINLAPKTALVVRDGKETEIPVEDVIIGDVIVVKPGERLPVDGVILDGSSAVDESALTGESIPVEKMQGDPVIAASINKSGSFRFTATRVGENTTLAQIIRLVEEASSSKAPIAKLADRVSGVFVPVVIAIAFLAAAVWLFLGQSFEFALSIGIGVLVISCPCALGLATPVAIMVGTGKGAENGILIKSGQALEIAHMVQTVVLDKTGTITMGKPRVTDIVTGSDVTEEELLCIAASIEKRSEHPFAGAIVEEADARRIPLCPVSGFQAIVGQGVEGRIDGALYQAGNAKFCIEHQLDMGEFEGFSSALSDDGKTPLYFADEHRVLGIVAVADVIKPTSREAVEAFQSMGIDVVMLTGDNRRTAAAIQKQLGIDRVISEVLPLEKEREIAAIQASGKKVAMIGDGINDAPALARADVGIAIGAGTDVAIESADIVLMKSDLLDAVTAIELSRAVIRNIKQNLFWAFFYNTIGIPLAAGVFYSVLGWRLSPMFGSAAMSLSSIFVVSNALRLKLFTPSRRHQSIINKGEVTLMKKTMLIEGMSCSHCSDRVEKALGTMEGVQAKVDLGSKTAHVVLSADVSDEKLTRTVTDAGYAVISISKE